MFAFEFHRFVRITVHIFLSAMVERVFFDDDANKNFRSS